MLCMTFSKSPLVYILGFPLFASKRIFFKIAFTEKFESFVDKVPY